MEHREANIETNEQQASILDRPSSIFAEPAEARKKLYICPGESHPISRSVHLARLAAFYPACRDCPFRDETGPLPKQMLKRLQSPQRRMPRRSPFTTEGVRGVYLNELTRKHAEKIVEAFAGLLWEAAPLSGPWTAVKRTGKRTRPTLVIGYDERPFSPDIVTGVIRAARRMGCQIVDVSLITGPGLWFAVDHLQASAGVFVTGSGCEPSWTGLDFVGPGARPWSRVSAEGGEPRAESRNIGQGRAGSGEPENTPRSGGAPALRPPLSALCFSDSSEAMTLTALEARWQQSFNRPTRHAGMHRTFQAFVPYRAGLWKHFHALRPLTVCCGCPSRLVKQILQPIFETLPCRLVLVDLPNRARNPLDGEDADVRRLAEAVRKHRAHVGMLIDDDAARCSFLDERGTLVPARMVTRLIAEHLLSDHPGRAVVIEASAEEALAGVIEGAGGRCIGGGTTLAECSQAMRDHGAIFGGGESGRFWHGESYPACDAVLTLAKMLSVLSQSDAPVSHVAHRLTVDS